MSRWLFSFVLFLGLSACSKPELPDAIVRAESTEALAAFRAELGRRFPAEQLAPFDTALQELQLVHMDRGVASAADRAAAMRATVNGKTVRAAEILGWQARRKRLRAEIADFSGMLERDLALRDKTAASGTPPAVTHRIENEQDILAKLRRLLAEADAQLTTWDAAPSADPLPNSHP
jgi:hypothetical protein